MSKSYAQLVLATAVSMFPAVALQVVEHLRFLNVVVNRNSIRIVEIRGGEALPLATGRENPNLPKE